MDCNPGDCSPISIRLVWVMDRGSVLSPKTYDPRSTTLEIVMGDPWSQDGFRRRLEWGRRGARVAAERGDILVVIDVLSFSTATLTAVHHGGLVYPCAWTDDPHALAAQLWAEAAVNRREAPDSGRFSLSPPTFNAIEPGTQVVLASTKWSTHGWVAAPA
jgi:hypothetical protein